MAVHGVLLKITKPGHYPGTHTSPPQWLSQWIFDAVRPSLLRFCF